MAHTGQITERVTVTSQGGEYEATVVIDTTQEELIYQLKGVYYGATNILPSLPKELVMGIKHQITDHLQFIKRRISA